MIGEWKSVPYNPKFLISRFLISGLYSNHTFERFGYWHSLAGGPSRYGVVSHLTEVAGRGRGSDRPLTLTVRRRVERQVVETLTNLPGQVIRLICCLSVLLTLSVCERPGTKIGLHLSGLWGNIKMFYLQVQWKTTFIHHYGLWVIYS